MFKALLRKQLMELFSAVWRSRITGRRRSRGGTVLFALLTVLLVAVLLLSFGMIAVPLCYVLEPLGFGWLYFAVMVPLALLVGAIAGAFVSHATLFEAKDNEMLLALPVPPGMILAARLVSVYLNCLVYVLLVWIPTEAAWLYFSGQRLYALLSAVLFALTLSGAAALLACLLGWAVAALGARARHKSVCTAAATAALLAVYVAGYQKLQDLLVALLADAAQMVPELRQKAGVLYWLGSAGCGNAAALVLLAALTAAAAVLFCRVLSRRYFRLMTEKRAAPKPAYKAAPTPVRSVDAALLAREWQRFVASSAYLINGAFGWVAFPLLGLAAVWKAASLRAALAQLPGAFTVPLMCALAYTLTGLLPVASASVSLEGKTIWLLQSMPVAPWRVLRTKLALHVLLAVPPALFCMVCVLAAAKVPAVQIAAALLMVVAFAAATAHIGLVFGLLLPHLHWTNEAAVIKQSGATGLALLCNSALGLLLCVLSALAAYVLAPVQNLLLCTAVLTLLCALLRRWLYRRGTVIFEHLA